MLALSYTLRERFIQFPEILPVEDNLIASPRAIPCNLLCQQSLLLFKQPRVWRYLCHDWRRNGLVLAKEREGRHLKGEKFFSRITRVVNAFFCIPSLSSCLGFYHVWGDVWSFSSHLVTMRPRPTDIQIYQSSAPIQAGIKFPHLPTSCYVR